MRKTIICLVILLLGSLVFLACNQSKTSQVSVMNFYYSSGWQGEVLKDANYYESILKVIPNYEEKMLDLDYSKVFPARTEVTLEEDFQTSGKVGEEYFVKFEELVEAFPEETIDIDVQWARTSEPFLLVETDKGELKISMSEENSQLDVFKQFFSEIESLLTQEEQI